MTYDKRWRRAYGALLYLLLASCGPPCESVAHCPELCGDGFIEEWEACDDGGDTANCDSDCSLPLCGDGHLNYYAGEECDDSGALDDGWCNSQCQRQTDPEWCEEVGQYGYCENDVLYFCQDGDYSDMICSLSYQNGTCDLVNVDWGYDCIAPTGHACLIGGGESSVRFAPCAGSQPGCGLAGGQSACMENMNPCDIGTPPTCISSTVLALCSPFGQPAQVACASYGNGSCLAEQGVCAGGGRGTPCIPGLVYCDAAYECRNAICVDPPR